MFLPHFLPHPSADRDAARGLDSPLNLAHLPIREAHVEPLQLSRQELYEAIETQPARTLPKRDHARAVVEVATSVAYQKLALTRR
jgi:hypothetical protein